ncbi:MAG TPA: dienelactone hydrolase family protein [Anaerolineales bacterium]|nr:dienelactone hydrolase family protein [Anaerolineales bacterium]
MEHMTFPELRDKMMRLYTEGKFADALQLVEQNADRFPEQGASTTFWKMCLLSLCGRPDDLIAVFQNGLDKGLWWAAKQFLDTDLDAVRDLPEFKRLAALSQEKYEEVRRHIPRDRTLLLPEPPTSGKYPLLIALHGRNGNKDSNLEHWEAARQRGWLVLSPQSTQPLFPGSYCWDEVGLGLTDLRYYYEDVLQSYPIDPDRILIGGFSQGSGMAIYAALKGGLVVRGFIGIGTWWADADELARERKDIRGYFVTGEKDHTLDRVREIQDTLQRNNVPFSEEVHADIGHEFPADFERSFDKAIDFIFMEQE